MKEVSLIGKNIRLLRKNKEMNLQKLANTAGVGIATISEIENGQRKELRSTTIRKIAAALNVSEDILFNPIIELTDRSAINH